MPNDPGKAGDQIVIRLSVVGIAACAILSACSNHQPAGYGGSPGGWSPGMASKARTLAEPKILPETFYAAGQLFEAQGLLNKAAIQYRKAAAVNHSFAAAYDRLGVTLGRLGKHSPAVEALQTAVELNPESAAFHNNLAFEFVLQGRWTEAEAELLQALLLEPNFDRAHINLGVVQANLDRFVDALNEFRKVVAEADAYYNLGLLLCGQHRYADAANAFEHVISLDYEFWAAHVQLDKIGPKLALSDALEPRLTIPFETTETEAPTEFVEETHPDTESAVVVMETDTDADMVPDVASTTVPTEVYETTTQTLLATDTDSAEEWEWPLEVDVATLVSQTSDPTIESQAPTDDAEILFDSPQDLGPQDDPITTDPAERTVLFSTVDGQAEHATWPTDEPLDDDWDCVNDSQWSFPTVWQWPFLEEYLSITPDIQQQIYDLTIECPADTADTAAIQPENVTDQPSAGGQASATPWRGDDSLEMPEPEWYQRAEGQTDGAE